MKAAKIEKEYSWVIVFDEQEIRRLYDEILKILTENNPLKPNLSIEIGYYDKSSFKTNSLDDLLSDENTSGKEIEFVSILGKSDDGKSIKIVFGGKNNITQLQIEGPDHQWLYVTKSTLEDRLKNFRKSVPRTGTLIFYLSIAILLLDIIIVPKMQNILPPITYPSADATNNPGWGLLIVILADLILFIVLSILIGYIFPNVSFLIGRGVARFENRIKLRSNLFWVVLVTSVLSIMLAILLKYLRI
jgi:hypothetical protein